MFQNTVALIHADLNEIVDTEIGKLARVPRPRYPEQAEVMYVHYKETEGVGIYWLDRQTDDGEAGIGFMN